MPARLLFATGQRGVQTLSRPQVFTSSTFLDYVSGFTKPSSCCLLFWESIPKNVKSSPFEITTQKILKGFYKFYSVENGWQKNQFSWIHSAAFQHYFWPERTGLIYRCYVWWWSEPVFFSSSSGNNKFAILQLSCIASQLAAMYCRKVIHSIWANIVNIMLYT